MIQSMAIEIDGVEFITTAEAVELAREMGKRLSQAAVSQAARRWADDGAESGIKNSKKVGNTWLVSRPDFIEWMRSRKPRGPKPIS